MKNHLTIVGGSTGEYSEKRSRFIATAVHCESEEDAQAFIGDMRSKYWDARHNVYAYVLKDGNIKRFSDDGEPHATAGKPVLEVIDGQGLSDIAVVVTRYFGGVLLGTGGLVRAYTAAAKQAVLNARLAEMRNCAVFETVCGYADQPKLTKLIESFFGAVLNTEFGEKICMTYSVEDTFSDDFKKNLCENFSASLEAKFLYEKFFPFKV